MEALLLASLRNTVEDVERQLEVKACVEWVVGAVEERLLRDQILQLQSEVLRAREIIRDLYTRDAQHAQSQARIASVARELRQRVEDDLHRVEETMGRNARWAAQRVWRACVRTLTTHRCAGLMLRLELCEGMRQPRTARFAPFRSVCCGCDPLPFPHPSGSNWQPTCCLLKWVGSCCSSCLIDHCATCLECYRWVVLSHESNRVRALLRV